MTTNELRDEILGIIRTVFDDKAELEKIHKFLVDEINIEPDDDEIPDKYKKVVSEVADNISSGFVCFINPDTLEVDDIPEFMVGSLSDDGTPIPFDYHKWEKCITIELLDSDYSYRVMEMFANKINDSKLQNELFNALNNRKPFANFNLLIDNSEYRQQWFDFRKKQYELHVWREIEYQLNDTAGE